MGGKKVRAEYSFSISCHYDLAGSRTQKLQLLLGCTLPFPPSGSGTCPSLLPPSDLGKAYEAWGTALPQSVTSSFKMDPSPKLYPQTLQHFLRSKVLDNFNNSDINIIMQFVFIKADTVYIAMHFSNNQTEAAEGQECFPQGHVSREWKSLAPAPLNWIKIILERRQKQQPKGKG